MCAELGVLIAVPKTESPTQVITFLGIESHKKYTFPRRSCRDGRWKLTGGVVRRLALRKNVLSLIEQLGCNFLRLTHLMLL